jgi:hypothetical protein
MQLSKNSSFKEGRPWLATTVKARATINRCSSAASDYALSLTCSDKATLVVPKTREPAKTAATKFHFRIAGSSELISTASHTDWACLRLSYA